MDKQLIREYIEDSIKEIVHELPENEDDNLLKFIDKKEYMIIDFMYIFELIEEKLGFTIVNILEQSDYNIMTIKMLTESIWHEYTKM